MSKNGKNKELYTLDENEVFINPYNFINVDFKKTQRTDISNEDNKKLTGVLECSLYPKTPFCIPDNQESVENKGHKKYPFFRYGDELIISGSSLRGVIRSVYETVTDSCFSTAKDNFITNRTREAFLPGLIVKKDGGYKLYEVKNRICVDKDLPKWCTYGDSVTYTLLKEGDEGYSEKRKTAKEIHKSEDMKKKVKMNNQNQG